MTEEVKYTKINDAVDVMQKLIDLTDTVEEGMKHIDIQLKELRFEEAILLLQDVVEAIATMQKALAPLVETLPANEVNPLTKDLMKQVDVFIDMYQKGNKEEMSEQIATIMPVCAKWKEEVARVLKPILTN